MTKRVTETERFYAWQDPGYPNSWNIKPRRVSGIWEYILGDMWWCLFEEERNLKPMFASLLGHLGEQADGESLYEAVLTVDYEFFRPAEGTQVTQLPGLLPAWAGSDHALHFWRIGATGRAAAVGIVRTVKMTPVFERSLDDQERSSARGDDLSFV